MHEQPVPIVPQGPRPAAERRPRRLRTINVRLLLISLVIVAALGGGAFLLHRHQVNRNAGMMIEQAEIFERQGKFVEAATQLNQYIALVGPRVDVLVKLAHLVEQDPQKDPREVRLLMRLYGRILGLDPALDDTRRKMARLLLETGSATRAAEEANEVLKHLEDDTESYRILADSHLAQERYNEAVPLYETVVKASPNDVMSWVRLASCYARTNLPELSREVLDRMVAANGEDGDAYYQRFLFRRTILKEDASEDMKRALELGPDNPDFLLAAGGDALSDKEWKKAIDYFDGVISRTQNQDTRSAALLGMGNAYVGMGRIDDAVTFWKRSLHEMGPRSLPIRLRLTEVLIDHGRIEAAREWIQLLREQERYLASLTTKSPVEVENAGRLIDWLEARYHLAAEEPQKAIPLLIAISQSKLSDDTTRHAALRTLASIYAESKQWEAVCDALVQAIAIKPNDIESTTSLAAALMEAGRSSEAQSHYERLANRPELSRAAWLPLARMRLLAEMAVPPDKRNWSRFDAAMAHARGSADAGLEPVALAATALAARGRHAEAQVILAVVELGRPLHWARSLLSRAILETGLFLTTALKERDRRVPLGRSEPQRFVDRWRREWSVLWVTRLSLLAQAGFEKEATSLAESLSRLAPANGKFLLLATARKLQDAGPGEALTYLQQRMPRTRREDHAQLLRMRELLASSTGDRLARRQTLEEMIALLPGDVETRLELFDDHFLEGNVEEAKKQLEGIRAVEGAGGTHVLHAEAMLALAQHSEDSAGARRLEELANELVRLRPRWGRTQYLQAAIARNAGNKEREIHYLEAAIAARFRRGDVFRRLLVLFLDKRDLAQADRYLAMLSQESIRSPDFLPIALQVSLGHKHFDEAERLAAQAVAERPGDAGALVWLGNVQRSAQRYAEAETSYRQAIKADPKLPDGYASLITLLASQSRRQEALQEIEAIKSAGAAGSEPEALLGICYATLGEKDQAKDYFLRASNKYPLSLAVQQQAAAFFLSQQMPEALDVIARLKALKPEDPSIRYGSALHLLFQPTARSWREGLELLGDHDSPYDLRLRALLLDRLGGVEERREAIGLLERLLAENNDASPRDRLNLAQLLDRDGRTEQSLAVLEPALSASIVPPDLLTASIEYSIKLGKLDDVPSKLEVLSRQTPGPAIELLRLRWLHAQNEMPALRDLAREILDQAFSKGDDPTAAMSLLDTLISLEQTDVVEAMFPEVVERYPSTFPLLMLFLARQGKADQAVEQCLSRADTAGSSAASYIVMAAKLGTAYRVHPDIGSKAARRLEELFTVQPTDAVQEALAELRLIEGDYETAERLYREVLNKDPSRAVALNNHALALAKLGRHDEANQQIFRAIDAAGPRPELLDTKAVLFIEAGRPREAMRLLRPLISDPKCGSLMQLHMALAQDQSGQVDRARDSFESFKKSHPASERLSACDQAYIDSLSPREGTRS